MNTWNRFSHENKKARKIMVGQVNNLPYTGVELAPVTAFIGELCERDKVQAALQGVEAVFHLAWTTVPHTSNDNPLADAQANLTASLQVLEACVTTGVRLVIFPSSGGTVYGLADRELLEETAPNEPICAYGITKLAVEKYLALYRHLHGLDYRVLRISNAYGAGQPTGGTQGLIGVALDKVMRRQPITIWGDGSATRDYIYAGDVAQAFVRATLTELPADAPRVFNIGSQQGTSIKELMAAIKAVTGLPLLLDYAPARGCDVDRVVLSNRRAAEYLEWVPQVSLSEGLSLNWNWMNGQHHLEAAA